MEDKSKDRATAHTQPAYDPPQAMRLSQVHTGQGLCEVPGSGDFEACYEPGNTAAVECLVGLSADGACLYSGSSATLDCLSPGNQYIG